MKPTPEQLAQKAVILARLALAERSYAQTAPSATLRHHGFAMARLLEQRVREIAQEIEKIGGWVRLNELAKTMPNLDLLYGPPPVSTDKSTAYGWFSPRHPPPYAPTTLSPSQLSGDEP